MCKVQGGGPFYGGSPYLDASLRKAVAYFSPAVFNNFVWEFVFPGFFLWVEVSKTEATALDQTQESHLFFLYWLGSHLSESPQNKMGPWGLNGGSYNNMRGFVISGVECWVL